MRTVQRPNPDEYFLLVARVVSLRSTCARRRVGCVLVDEQNRILSTGYNGVPSGRIHCIDVPCAGAGLPSGIGLDECEAIHAEQNAIVFCSEVRSVNTCYTTTAPCTSCIKLLLNTNCRRIVFEQSYVHVNGIKLWRESGKTWLRKESTSLDRWI